CASVDAADKNMNNIFFCFYSSNISILYIKNTQLPETETNSQNLHKNINTQGTKASYEFALNRKLLI
ncbi:hypothetical protein ACJX0J_035299, partial [Zea mays]